MDTDELPGLLHSLRRFGTEPSDVEVKSGLGGFPGSVRETLVAFANTDGGTILIGVDEASEFSVIDLQDVANYRDRLVELSRSTITPPLHLDTELVELEGKRILVAYVPPVAADQRPVYVTTKGVPTGAYLRTGDGDRRMSETEIAMVYASRTQPMYDRESVPGATIEELDRHSIGRTLERVRVGSTYLREADDVTALHRLGVLAEPNETTSPTVAGLLTFGRFPQQHFPQLMVSVAVHPSDNEPSDVRFLDNVTLRGPIPEIVAEALATVRRNLSARAVTVDGSREDRLGFPLPAIREALVNALLHRDYSPVTRGTQVQIDLMPDRLIIRSPGGLYGPVTEEDLGEIDVSSSRNAGLALLLSDVYLPRTEQLVAENRASGIPIMIDQTRRSGLPRPVFESRVTSFSVTMGRSELLGPDVRRWLSALGVPLPTPAHEIAAAMMRGGFVTNAGLREWGVERHVAGAVLRDLTASGIAVRQGGRRYARYVLDPSAAPVSPPVDTVRRSDVGEALRRLRTASAADLEHSTGLRRAGVLNRLNALIASGQVRSIGAPRSPKRMYTWVGTPD